MQLLLIVVGIWCYVVIGFALLALAVVNAEPFDTGDANDAGFAVLLLWPIYIPVIAVREIRYRRALHELRQITDSTFRVARAYKLLGRYQGDRAILEIEK